LIPFRDHVGNLSVVLAKGGMYPLRRFFHGSRIDAPMRAVPYYAVLTLTSYSGSIGMSNAHGGQVRMSKPRLSEFLNEMRAQTPPLPDYDQDKVDAAVLALLYLTLHQPGPYLAWKGLDWAALDRLYSKGTIDDPKNKNKSVGLTDERVAEAAAAFQRLFGSDGDAR
jgi:hypothetical protein